MRRFVRIGLAVMAGLVTLTGCKYFSGIIHNEPLAAKVGAHELTVAALKDMIPDGLSPEDSAAYAQQVIESWARDMIFLERAESELSASELDVSQELEDYRKSLLKYRYQQKYIAEHLDSLVTPEEILAYYEANPEKFRQSDGTLAPVDSCTRWIEDIILGIRKHDLTLEMEELLVESARENSQIIVY